MSKPGRPTQDPSGRKRVKRQPWVSADTAWAMDFEARRDKTTIGHVVDSWLRDRATQTTKALAPMPKKNNRAEEEYDPNEVL